MLEELAKASSNSSSAGYGPILGEESLRKSVANEMQRLYQWSKGSGVSWEEVAISAGCNQAYLAVMLALCMPGDEVIIPVPWVSQPLYGATLIVANTALLPQYFNHLMTLQMLQIKPIPLEAAFVPAASEAEKLITSRTKAIVLVTPNNPTGQIYSPSVIAGFADLAKKYNLALIIDETYRDFIRPEGTRPHELFSRLDWQSNVISLFSFSKSYKVPGHRLGGIVAAREVLESVTTVADCMQICPPRPPQLALAPLLETLREDLAETSARLNARHKLFKQVVEAVEGWKVECQGGFFAYVRHPFVGKGSEVIGENLARQCGVVTLPGAFFMPDNGSNEMEALKESPLAEDRWIRFAVANVNDDAVKELGSRLEMMNKLQL